jgi:predicted nucleic acid-binding protein
VYLLDTSALIGDEQGRLEDGLPTDGDAAISVVTLAELHLGVLAATSDEHRRVRLSTLLLAQEFDPLPVTSAVAEHFAGLVIAARNLGRKLRPLDTLIAATAAAHSLTLVTQDGDFVDLPVDTHLIGQRT